MLANSWLHLSVLNLVTVQALGQHEKSGSVRNNEYNGRRRKGTRFVKHLLHHIRSINLSSSQWLSEISKYFCPSGGSLRFQWAWVTQSWHSHSDVFGHKAYVHYFR